MVADLRRKIHSTITGNAFKSLWTAHAKSPYCNTPWKCYCKQFFNISRRFKKTKIDRIVLFWIFEFFGKVLHSFWHISCQIAKIYIYHIFFLKVAPHYTEEDIKMKSEWLLKLYSTNQVYFLGFYSKTRKWLTFWLF